MRSIAGLIESVEAIQKSWFGLAIVTQNFEVNGVSIAKSDVGTEFEKMKLVLMAAQESNLVIGAAFYYQAVTQISIIKSYLDTHLPSSALSHLPGFLTGVYNLAVSIENAFPSVPIEGQQSGSVNLSSNLVDALAKASYATVLLKETDDLVQKNKEISLDIKTAAAETQDIASIIVERNRATSIATDNILEIETRSLNLVDKLNLNIGRADESYSQILAQQNSLKLLYETLEQKLIEAQRLLEDSNRHGLAGAFKSRGDELKSPAKIWIVCFVTCVAILTWFAHETVAATGADWRSIIFRLPISAPLIWMAWFAVKQYGYTRRIQEDYKFKVASAMSYEGYKREMNSDIEFIKLLQKSAIENFSMNPLRIYEANSNHGSPINEIFQSIGQDKLKEVVEILKILAPLKK